MRDELVVRAVVQIQRCADLLDLAVAQHHDAMRERHGLDLVVSHVDRGSVELTVQLRDFHPRLPAQRGVEIGQRLVEQEHLGRADDRPADRHALALPARELLRRALEIRCQVENLGGALDFLADHRRIGLRQHEREAHVVVDGHVRVQRVALEHHRQIALRRRQPGDVAPFQVHGAADRPFPARRSSAAASICRSPTGPRRRRTRPSRS